MSGVFVSSLQSCILLSEPQGPPQTLGDKQTPLFAQLSRHASRRPRPPLENTWRGHVTSRAWLRPPGTPNWETNTDGGLQEYSRLKRAQASSGVPHPRRAPAFDVERLNPPGCVTAPAFTAPVSLSCRQSRKRLQRFWRSRRGQRVEVWIHGAASWSALGAGQEGLDAFDKHFNPIQEQQSDKKSPCKSLPASICIHIPARCGI